MYYYPTPHGFPDLPTAMLYAIIDKIFFSLVGTGEKEQKGSQKSH
jgi:hypothetical protein